MDKLVLIFLNRTPAGKPKAKWLRGYTNKTHIGAKITTQEGLSDNKQQNVQ